MTKPTVHNLMSVNKAIDIMRDLAADIHRHNALPSYKEVHLSITVDYDEENPVVKFKASVGYDHSCEGSDLLKVINELQHRMDFDDKYKAGRTLKALPAPVESE